MAELEISSLKGKAKGHYRRIKHSARIDLTPMVDLGFLLITFFIFTTSLAQPVAMNLIVPDDRPVMNPNEVSAEKTLTIVLRNHSVFYYNGFFNNQFEKAEYKQLREIITENKQRVLKKFHSNCLSIIIKPSVEVNYKNIVNCLDEMTINEITTYVLVDPEEKELISLRKVQ